MSNADVVRRAFAAADHHDKAALFACLDPGIQWHMLGLLSERAAVQHGREAVWAYAEEMHRAVDGLASELFDVEEMGDRVVVRIRTRGRGRDGAGEVDVRYTGVFLVRDGRIVRGRNFDDHEEALTEAALRA
jgi:ketosteroid isomerase-like protein